MRPLAYIQKIKSLAPIPGADQIEKAEILGWELVVKKGDFKAGDLCVYCEIDSILPEYPCFEFLRSKKFRIKTIKLKGQISQGIAFPLSVLNQVDPNFNISKVQIEDDVTEILKITKFDPEAKLDFAPTKKTWWQNKISYLKWKLLKIKPVAKSDFPQDVPKTDEIRVQNISYRLERQQGTPMYCTEKLEGTSATFIFRKGGNWLSKIFAKDYVFLSCSRNKIVYESNKKDNPNHHNINIMKKYDLINSMKRLNRNLAIQGEIIGPQIQGNIYKLPAVDFRVFLIYCLDNKRYLTLDEMMSVTNELGLTMVPILDTEHLLVSDVKYYVKLSQGKSQLNPGTLREGIVVRAKDASFSFKSINPEYLLRENL